MSQQDIQIVQVFTTDDQAWIRRTSVEVPKFWRGHTVSPATGDVDPGRRPHRVHHRGPGLGARSAPMPVLRLFLSSGHARSDTTFG